VYVDVPDTRTTRLEEEHAAFGNMISEWRQRINIHVPKKEKGLRNYIDRVAWVGMSR
jgi:hypothetical protein